MTSKRALLPLPENRIHVLFDFKVHVIFSNTFRSQNGHNLAAVHGKIDAFEHQGRVAGSIETATTIHLLSEPKENKEDFMGECFSRD